MFEITEAEQGSLRFVLDWPGPINRRYAIAFALFALGIVTFALGIIAAWPLAVLAGHAVLWNRDQTTAPGGATPSGELTWAPVEADWQARVKKLEAAGERWDTSPWDITSGLGVGVLLLVMMGIGLVAAIPFGSDYDGAMLLFGVLLLLPAWINGARTTWNPSELRLKGDSLALAEHMATTLAPTRLEPVPLLALRQGSQGRYPVDARLMLRPRDSGDANPFIGIQVQVSLNNVQGTDYPYLYCVILMRPGHAPPRVQTGDVTEYEQRNDVSFAVVRQHADDHGGWHTEPGDVRRLVKTAIQATEGL